jgi:2-polyprenyl-3-methyl-5-hydroxy-6-metoxy-1,4-benzoquinol methylase
VKLKDVTQIKNKNHYDNLYDGYNVNNILYWLNNLEEFLTASINTETSWFALYKDDFRGKLKGKRVLEMGCGNGVNASVMAALGANVYANDISTSSGDIIKKVNSQFSFEYPVQFIEGDFLENELENNSFDFIIGKAFLHHLSLPLEQQFLKETARLLKNDGEARFFEPAVNNKVLDELRWLIPVKGRPSKFNRKAFSDWQLADPHPARSFSSKHFEESGKNHFKEVEILPVGTLERFSRFLKWGESRNRFKKWALANEKRIPITLNKSFARSQLIVFRKPL